MRVHVHHHGDLAVNGRINAGTARKAGLDNGPSKRAAHAGSATAHDCGCGGDPSAKSIPVGDDFIEEDHPREHGKFSTKGTAGGTAEHHEARFAHHNAQSMGHAAGKSKGLAAAHATAASHHEQAAAHVRAANRSEDPDEIAHHQGRAQYHANNASIHEMQMGKEPDKDWEAMVRERLTARAAANQHKPIEKAYARFKDSFNEADHPRDGGKFATKGGGNAAHHTERAAHHIEQSTQHRIKKDEDRAGIHWNAAERHNAAAAHLRDAEHQHKKGDLVSHSIHMNAAQSAANGAALHELKLNPAGMKADPISHKTSMAGGVAHSNTVAPNEARKKANHEHFMRLARSEKNPESRAHYEAKAKAALDGAFEESKHKRDPGGKFKAGSIARFNGANTKVD